MASLLEQPARVDCSPPPSWPRPGGAAVGEDGVFSTTTNCLN